MRGAGWIARLSLGAWLGEQLLELTLRGLRGTRAELEERANKLVTRAPPVSRAHRTDAATLLGAEHIVGRALEELRENRQRGPR